MASEVSSVSTRLRCYYILLAVYLASQLIFLKIFQSYNHNRSNAVKILEIYKTLSETLNKESQVDNSGLYKFVKTKKAERNTGFDLTVVSQCSSNHFSSVEDLFKAWDGPISVAVYSEVESIEQTLWNMARFMYCNNFRDFGMQLVLPVQDTYITNYQFPYGLLHDGVSCDDPYLSANGRRNYNWTSPYPVNLMRNIAKSGTSTDYILVIDIDMIPSSQLRLEFIDYVSTKISWPVNIVYVVPAFEIHSDASVPLDKTKLSKMIEQKDARPFYVIPCENCQKLTQYNRWLDSGYSSGVRVLYEVKWKHPWEPFLITKRDVPNFDERFKQYGMNRVSQICELHVAGFKFVILDHAFLIHKGFKTLDGFHNTKNKEMEANRRLYERFKIEIRYKYPKSNRTC